MILNNVWTQAVQNYGSCGESVTEGSQGVSGLVARFVYNTYTIRWWRIEAYI